MTPGSWIVIALAALFGAQFALHPALAYPAVAVALWLLRRRLSSWARLLFLVTVALSAWRAHRSIKAFSLERESVRKQLGASERCAGRGEITESPVLRQGKYVIVLRASVLECESIIEGTHLVRIVGGPDGLARGDEVTFVAQLGPVSPPSQIELPSPLPRLASKGVIASGGALSVELVRRGTTLLALIDRARAHVRRRILATYAPRAEALGRALVLGENDLDAEDQLAFQKSGLSHLLAVSGTHLVFAVASIVGGLRSLLLRLPLIAARTDVRRIATAAGLVLSLFYADFAGGSGSAFRAAFMLSAVYLATTLRRRLRGIHALAYSMLLGALLDPLVGYDISFLLSAGATAGLIVIGPLLIQPLTSIRLTPLRVLLTALATTVSAMLPCVPLLLLLSPAITLVGLVANVVAGPLGETLALPTCLLHTLAAPFPRLEAGLALAGSGALLAVAFIAKLSAAVRVAQIALPPPTVAQFVCLGVTTLAFALVEPKERCTDAAAKWNFAAKGAVLGIGLIGFAVLELVARSSGAPIGKLRITSVDVGQGDSLLIDLPDGKLMLVDGGGAVTGGADPGQFILAPLLRARRRSRIDVAVLTHPHPDHFGGLLTLLPQLPVGEFWEAGENRPEYAASELSKLRQLLRSRGTTIRNLPELCASPRQYSGASIEVMGPCPEINQNHDKNDQSIVLRLSYGRRVALLPGDAEVTEEQELILLHGNRLQADLLKIGHHGSKSSSSAAWLATVRPAMALISVGLRNRFGHPHPTTLARLGLLHVPVYRTDELGSIQWITDGRDIEVAMAHSRAVVSTAVGLD